MKWIAALAFAFIAVSCSDGASTHTRSYIITQSQVEGQITPHLIAPKGE